MLCQADVILQHRPPILSVVLPLPYLLNTQNLFSLPVPIVLRAAFHEEAFLQVLVRPDDFDLLDVLGDDSKCERACLAIFETESIVDSCTSAGLECKICLHQRTMLHLLSVGLVALGECFTVVIPVSYISGEIADLTSFASVTVSGVYCLGIAFL